MALGQIQSFAYQENSTINVDSWNGGMSVSDYELEVPDGVWIWGLALRFQTLPIRVS